MKGLLDTLDEIALDAGNAPAKGNMHIPTELLGAYHSWIDSAERRLENMLTRRDIEALLLTRRHWSLRSMDGGSSGLVSAVRLELAQRKAAVEALRDELAAFHAHWKTRSGVVAVPDTNVFLHSAQPIDALPWSDVLGKRVDIHVIVPLIVVDELDKAKRHNNKKLQRAARHSLRWLESLRGGTGPGSSNLDTASLEILADPPEHVRTEDADYEILDRVAMLKRLTSLRVCVVTQDLGMRVRAESLGIEALAAPNRLDDD